MSARSWNPPQETCQLLGILPERLSNPEFVPWPGGSASLPQLGHLVPLDEFARPRRCRQLQVIVASAAGNYLLCRTD